MEALCQLDNPGWIAVSGNKNVKGRKDHRCDYCDNIIPKLEPHIQRTGIECGEGFYTMHLHCKCEEETRGWTSADWENR